MKRSRWAFVLLASTAVAVSGCLQLETKIQLNEDGSAVVTERFALSRRLIEMAKREENAPDLESLLTRKAAVERAKTATFEPQSWIYPILVASLWGRPPKKIIHYIVQKPTIRLKKKETLAEYIARVPEWYKDKQAERPNDPPIVRSEFPVTGPLYPRSKMLMLKKVSQVCNASPPHLDNFPETGAPYQCKGCAFVALCQSDPVTWVDQIAARFRQRKETK